MTTLDKINALVQELLATPAEELTGEGSQFVQMIQIARGLGVDPLALLIPQTEAEADLFVDKTIALLFSVRGDDLPPFTFDRYGEAEPA